MYLVSLSLSDSLSSLLSLLLLLLLGGGGGCGRRNVMIMPKTCYPVFIQNLFGRGSSMD